MKKAAALALPLLLFGFAFAQEGAKPKVDTFTFGQDTLKITFYGHASLMLDFNGLVVQIDPVSRYAKYEAEPKADLILVTHEHGDHLDPAAVDKLAKSGTVVVTNQSSAGKLKNPVVMKSGDSIDLKGIRLEAVPAYNTTPGREQFHPKGRDNGFVLTLGQARVYVAGDTEDIPEMSALKDIDIAFLPVNQPYTMTPAQADKAARTIKPRVLYPYHFGDTDVKALERSLKDSGIEVRLRDLK